MHHHPIRISARVPGALADRAPANSLPPIPADRLRAIFETHRVVVDRFDGPARHRIIHGEPSVSQRILVRLMWLVCCAYCVAIWTGFAR